MKVLILCNDFPPINSIGAERPYSWYFYFKEQGIEPVIITKNWDNNNDSRFLQVKNNKTVENTEKGTIIRVNEGLTPSLWFRNKFGEKFSIVRKSLTFIGKLLSFNLFLFDQHREIYNAAKEYLKANEIDLIITTGEPFILFKYGHLLRSKNNIKWIADYRDGWYLNHVRSLQTDFGNRFIHKYEFKFEKKFLKNVDLITSVDPSLTKRLSDLLNKPSDVVYNGFWEYYESESTNLNKTKLVLNHTGTLTIGQRAEFLLEVLVELVDNENINSDLLEVNFIGLDYFPEQSKRINDYNEKLKNIVKTTKRLPKEEAISMNLKADYLINFTDENFSAIYAKTYDYIACKKSILVIPGDNGMLDELIIDNNLGNVFNEKEELKIFILNALKNTNEKKESFKNQENLDKFKRSYQSNEFVKIIKNLTK